MQDDKIYKNADLINESDEQFGKTLKNNFVTDDFERHLDLAMYLSKTKFKQCFTSKGSKPTTINTFDKAYLISSGNEAFNNINFFAPLTDLQATPQMFPNLNLKIFQIGEDINFKKIKYLSPLERRGLDIKKKHAYSIDYAFYKNDTDSFYALENGYQLPDEFFKLGENNITNSVLFNHFPMPFSLKKGYHVNLSSVTKTEIIDITRLISTSYSVMMSLYYEWTIYIKENDGLGFVIPINTFFLKDMFDSSLMKFENKAKLIHFVSQHYRKKPKETSGDLSVFVNRYLRGENKIVYRDYSAEIIPPKYELNRLKTRKKITDIFS